MFKVKDVNVLGLWCIAPDDTGFDVIDIDTGEVYAYRDPEAEYFSFEYPAYAMELVNSKVVKFEVQNRRIIVYIEGYRIIYGVEYSEV